MSAVTDKGMSKNITRNADCEALQARGLTSRSLQVRAASANTEARTVEAILTTDAPTLVFDWKRWEPIEEVLVMGGAQIPDSRQVVMLANHARWSLDDVAGSIRSIRAEGGALIGTLHFAGDDESEKAWQKVRDGHITDVSVGYRVVDYTDIEPGKKAVIAGREYTAGKYPLRVSTRWELKEGSLVPIGADPGAKIREDAGAEPAGKEKRMEVQEAGAPQESENKREAGPLEPVSGAGIDLEAVRRATQEAIAAERAAEAARVDEIRKLGGKEIDADLITRAVTEGWSVDKAKSEFLEAFRKAIPEPSRSGPAVIIHGSAEPTRDAMATGLLMRLGKYVEPKATTHEAELRNEQAHERALPFSGLSLVEMCREALRADGLPIPHNRTDMVRSAMSSGTLTFVFTQSVDAMVMQGFEAAPDTTRGWTRSRPVANFKQQDRGRLSPTNGMKPIGRGETAPHATVEDLAESYRISTFGEQFVMGYQDVIDDDMGMLMDIPMQLGQDAADIRPELVYSILLENPAMRDTVALFHGDHGNLAEAGSVLSADGLRIAVLKMWLQTDGPRKLNIRPTHLIVPPDLAFTAMQLVESIEIRESDAANGTKNVMRDLGLQVVSDSRLKLGTTNPKTGTFTAGSAQVYYLASANHPTIEVGELAGTGGRPMIRSFNLDRGQWGIGWDIKLELGAKALDWRALVKATGAGA